MKICSEEFGDEVADGAEVVREGGYRGNQKDDQYLAPSVRQRPTHISSKGEMKISLNEIIY